jgi:hypothetical protein
LALHDAAPCGAANGLSFGNLHRTLPLYVRDMGSVTSMFIDRFLISIFVGLELTGVYTLFWSVANVVHSLAVHGLLQAQLPQIISTAQTGDQSAFHALERRLQIETYLAAKSRPMPMGSCCLRCIATASSPS